MRNVHVGRWALEGVPASTVRRADTCSWIMVMLAGGFPLPVLFPPPLVFLLAAVRGLGPPPVLCPA